MEDSCGFVALVVSCRYPEYYEIMEIRSIRDLLYVLNRSNSLCFQAGLRPYTIAGFIWNFHKDGDDQVNYDERKLHVRNLNKQLNEVTRILGSEKVDWQVTIRTMEYVFKRCHHVAHFNKNLKMHIPVPVELSKQEFLEMLREAYGPDWFQHILTNNLITHPLHS